MKALVTGARGFVGPHLIELLLRKGVEVCALVYQNDRLEHGAELPEAVRLVEGDIRDGGLLASLLRGLAPDQIYHLAGITNVPLSVRKPRLTYSVNLEGTLNLYETVRELGLPARILNVSSAHVYGSLPVKSNGFDESCPVHGDTPYAASKIMCEMLAWSYAQTFGLQIMTVRAFNHIGPRQPAEFVCSDFARQVALMLRGEAPPVLQVGNLEAARDFTDVRDVVAAYWEVVNRGRPGEIYNVCSGTLRTMGELIEMLRQVSKVPIRVQPDPAKFRSTDTLRLAGNGEKIFRELGWRPQIPFEQTLTDLLAYWQQHLAANSAAVKPAQS